MTAHRRDVESVKEIQISASRVKEKPKYTMPAAALLKRCREFYEDEENEKAFQEWKETRKKGA